MISLKKTTDTRVDQAKHVPTTASLNRKLLVSACSNKHANAPQSRGKIEYPKTQTLWKKLMRPPNNWAFKVTMAAPAQTWVEVTFYGVSSRHRRDACSIAWRCRFLTLLISTQAHDHYKHRGEDQCALRLRRARRQGY